MRTRLLRGLSASLDGVTLKSGILALDTERKALRLYDGTTPGGFEILGQQAYVPPVGPGPTELIAGDETTGFFGEVTGEDLITYSDLSAAVGLSAGVLQHDAESLWLKFMKDDQVLFVAKKTIRHSISWDNINAVGLVYDTVSTPTVQVGSDTFRVTLMTGADADPATANGGEWNRLIYPIHTTDPNGVGWGLDYTNEDLIIGTGDGKASWTQETPASDAGRRINRGNTNLLTYTSSPSSFTNSLFGWRPVLRLQP